MRAPPLPDVMTEGERHKWMTSLAGSMRRYPGVTAEAILAALRVTNDEKCRPPLPDRELRSIAHSVARYAPTATSEELTGKRERPIALTVSMMEQTKTFGVELFHDADGGAFISLAIDGHRETHPLRSSAFRDWLAHRTYETLRRVPSETQVREVTSLLAHEARIGPQYPAPVRIAAHDGNLYLDLGDPTWRAVEIDAKSWRVVAQPPIRFQRSRGLLPLPAPERGGSLADLWRFCNVAEADRCLFVAFLLGALYPSGPYPLLDFVGAPGNGKSSTAEYAKRLIDPGDPPTRSQPRSEEDLMIAATRSQLIALDNLSWAPEWLVDALCRLATGAGLGKRQKYTDADEWVLKAMRPVMLTSLGGVASRADLLDRSIILDLPLLPKDRRRTKRRLDERFARAHPALLGALLDAVVVGLRKLPSTKLREYPRMADFARWAVACEPALPWPRGTFLKRYAANQAGRQRTALDANPFVPHLVALLRAEGGQWKGSMTKLLRALSDRADAKQFGASRRKAWPQSARWLGTRLSELQQALEEQRGIAMRWGRSGSKRWLAIQMRDER